MISPWIAFGAIALIVFTAYFVCVALNISDTEDFDERERNDENK
ncbi:MAG: hypothetical protein AAFU78_22830 [Cyanobacteria bacterium J06633_2]